jgi:hypothetical protein
LGTGLKGSKPNVWVMFFALLGWLIDKLSTNSTIFRQAPDEPLEILRGFGMQLVQKLEGRYNFVDYFCLQA